MSKKAPIPNPNWPSKTGKPSGPKRGNNPPKTSSKSTQQTTKKK